MLLINRLVPLIIRLGTNAPWKPCGVWLGSKVVCGSIFDDYLLNNYFSQLRTYILIDFALVDGRFPHPTDEQHNIGWSIPLSNRQKT